MVAWRRQAVSSENWVSLGWGGLFGSGFLSSPWQATALVTCDDVLIWPGTEPACF